MPNEILCYILQFQAHSLILRQLIQAEFAKEYKADWLKNADTVIRDGTGKFAKKGVSIAQSVQDTTAILKQGFDLTTDTIQSLLKDPEFRKRAGLAAGLPMAKLISNLATQARLNPKLTEKLDEWIANATKEFADQYGDDKSPMAQAIRNSKLTQPPKDASFNEKMEFRVAQFAAYKEALESPEDYSKRDELIGKAAAAAIPIGVSLAIALGFEVAIPLFMAQGVNWATVLSSVAIGEAADFAVQKGMDKLEINNPALRIGASMVAGILAGGLVTGVNGIKKAPFRYRVGNKKTSIDKALNEMGLDFSEISKTIDNYNNSQKTQGVLHKEIKSIIRKKDELADLMYSLQGDGDKDYRNEIYKKWNMLDAEIGDKIMQLRVSAGHGYSPEKRLLEAVDILEKEGADSPRYLWRKAVLQAEVRYGKYLNNIRDDIGNSYDELMTSLVKGHKYKSDPIFISYDDSKRIKKEVLGESFGSESLLPLTKNMKNKINNIINDFQKYINIPLKTHVGSVVDHVYMFPGKKSTPKISSVYESELEKLDLWSEESNGFIDVGGSVSLGNDNIGFKQGYSRFLDQDTQIKGSIWHEMGHILEASIENVVEISRSLLKDRETESLLIGDEIRVRELEDYFSSSSNTGEQKIHKVVIAVDNFFNPYMGVQHIRHDTLVATELISSGFEGLSSPWMAKSMTNRDRESLLYAIAVSEMK